MEKELQNEYNNLFFAYKEMAESKLVLAEKSISEILRQVAQNDGIYNLIAELVLGFNFDKELKLAMKDGALLLPSAKEKIIPLVFCILNEIDNGKISAITFITTTFNDNKEEGYKKFCKEVVEPFVFAIKELLGAEDSQETVEEQVDEMDDIKKLFNEDLKARIKYIITEVDGRINALKKCDVGIKNAVSTICFSLDVCLAEEEYLGVFGLLSGLKMALVQLKKFKNEIKEIDLLLNVLQENG